MQKKIKILTISALNGEACKAIKIRPALIRARNRKVYGLCLFNLLAWSQRGKRFKQPTQRKDSPLVKRSKRGYAKGSKQIINLDVDQSNNNVADNEK